ncbi:hypothetical protein CWI36_1614p0010 [Hamiltosporidium magnivora]|uniref:Uncharacterized protein n=1 Tax=Hamiltosporidium magnivora TaxID=148818 RepID=A0A4Q9L162_9MICR|nr:hypothetical protein CWI36_1614p0010 [Hamiltosporidium magnivora]
MFANRFFKGILAIINNEEKSIILKEFCGRKNISFLVFKQENATVGLSILSSCENNSKYWSEEIISLCRTSEQEFTSIFLNNFLKVLVNHNILVFPCLIFDFMKEYIEKLGDLISKSECGIYYIRHNICESTLDLNLKSSFEGFERNESISIIEVENELKSKGNYLTDISVLSQQEFFHKFLDMYVKRINPRYFEEYQDICKLIKKILLKIRDTFIQIKNVMNHISLSETLKYIFEDIIKIMG